jgi:hypothetical protein
MTLFYTPKYITPIPICRQQIRRSFPKRGNFSVCPIISSESITDTNLVYLKGSEKSKKDDNIEFTVGVLIKRIHHI